MQSLFRNTNRYPKSAILTSVITVTAPLITFCYCLMHQQKSQVSFLLSMEFFKGELSESLKTDENMGITKLQKFRPSDFFLCPKKLKSHLLIFKTNI